MPVFLYPLTHAYFMTYFTVLLFAERMLIQKFQPSRLVGTLVMGALSYGLAFGETYFMASPHLSEWFYYENRDRMMTWGSLGYMGFFIMGLPSVARIDSNGEDWSLGNVVMEALGTFMAILVSFELQAKVAGPLTPRFNIVEI